MNGAKLGNILERICKMNMYFVIFIHSYCAQSKNKSGKQ